MSSRRLSPRPSAVRRRWRERRCGIAAPSPGPGRGPDAHPRLRRLLHAGRARRRQTSPGRAEALYRAADNDRARSREQKFGLDYGHDDTNQRVWNVLSRDPVFEDLVEHPLALDFVRAVLGWPALLGNLSANITGPGGGEMVLHADQIFVPEPWAAEPQGLNVAWCLDDFTEANGATRIVPGSHRLNRAPRADEAECRHRAAGGAGRLDRRLREPCLAQDRLQPHQRPTARRGVRLVHQADLPGAGELVPLPRSRDPHSSPPTTCWSCLATRPRGWDWSTGPLPPDPIRSGWRGLSGCGTCRRSRACS